MGSYIDHLPAIALEDARFLAERDKSYGSSWKKRGGIGAFMMAARKWDRLETILSKLGRFGGGDKDAQPYDLFKWIQCESDIDKRNGYVGGVGRDGSVLAEVRDLRRYLMLVEAEMVERGIVAAPPDEDVTIFENCTVEYTRTPGYVPQVTGKFFPEKLPIGTDGIQLVDMADRGLYTWMEKENRYVLKREPGQVPAEDSNRHALQEEPEPTLRRQVNHSELVDLPKEYQIRYKFSQAEQSYILQDGREVNGHWFPGQLSSEEVNRNGPTSWYKRIIDYGAVYRQNKALGHYHLTNITRALGTGEVST